MSNTMVHISKPNSNRMIPCWASQEKDLREYLEKYFSLSAREEAIRQHRLYSMEVEITRACNLECPYCYSESCASSKESLPLDVVRRILREAYEYGIRSVSWFGGEPLLYPQLFDILKYAKDLGYLESIIYTNGISLTPEVARRLRNLVDCVAVHMDTLSPNTFHLIHNRRSSELAARLQNNIAQSFEHLLSADFSPEQIRLTLTLCKPGFNGLEELFNWAFNKIGLQTSIFIPMAPVGRGRQLSKDWYMNQDEIRTAYELRAKYEHRPYLLELGISEYCKQYQMTMCYIQTDGSIIPYAGSQMICGSIFQSSIEKMITKNYDELAFLKYSGEHKNLALAGVCFDCQNQQYCFGNPVFAQNSNHSINSCRLWWQQYLGK